MEKIVDMHAYFVGAVMLITFFMIWSVRGKPWSFVNFIGSVILIGVAVDTLVYFPVLISTFVEMHDRGIVSAEILAKTRKSESLWLAAIPLLSGGVGINIFSSFLSSEKPVSIKKDI